MKNFCFALCIALLIYIEQAFGSESGMPQLDTKFWAAQAFWLILIFSFLYLIIWKIFLPKITYSIENRKSKVVNDLDQAQKFKENAEKKLQEYNEIINSSKKEAKKIIEESQKKLEKDIEIKKKKISEEIDEELKIVEKEIKDLRKSSISNIVKISSEISSEITKQLIDTDVNQSSVVAIVDGIAKRKMEKNI